MERADTTPDHGPTVEVIDLHKRYGDVRAVDGVSFHVAPGEIFGLLGPNGAGKTTVLEIIEGLRQPDSGQARLLDQPVWPRNQALLPRIGVQLQASAFFDRLTAREQLETFASLYGAPRRRVDEALADVGLTDSARVRVEKLSGGQAQRLALACAFVHDPDIVFLDEPSAGLDPQSRQQLWHVIRALAAGGRTVVMSTHYMEEAEALCDRVAIMDAGQVLALDAPARLVRHLDVPVLVSVPAECMTADSARRLDGAERVEGDGATTTIATRQRARVLHQLDQRHLLDVAEVTGASLEDVFLSLTGRRYHDVSGHR
ncbi:MAG: ABC transporter ATP-binding protein [Acidimicrobiales bacterium]